MISIVHGSPQLIWVPVVPATTIYTGAVVSIDTSSPQEGVIPMPVAAGASNTTNKDIPFGVVVGNNNIAGVVGGDSYITSPAAGAPHGSTTQFQGVEGPWAKGDPIAMVQVAVIDPSSVLRAPLCMDAVGTAPTVVTVSTGSTDGLGVTTDAADVATVAGYSTIYFRSGANKGIYRQLDTASATIHAWDVATKNDIAIGDTAVVINGLNPFGLSKAFIEATGRAIDIDEALTANYLFINVLRLDLSEAGKEYVEFHFNIENFMPLTART